MAETLKAASQRPIHGGIHICALLAGDLSNYPTACSPVMLNRSKLAPSAVLNQSRQGNKDESVGNCRRSGNFPPLAAVNCQKFKFKKKRERKSCNRPGDGRYSFCLPTFLPISPARRLVPQQGQSLRWPLEREEKSALAGIPRDN